MRGRRPEKNRGGKGSSSRSSSSSRRSVYDGAKRPHSRGRISKAQPFPKRSREVQTSARPGLRKGGRQQQHAKKKGRKRVPSHNQATGRHHGVGSEQKMERQSGRDTEKFRTASWQEIQRGGNRRVSGTQGSFTGSAANSSRSGRRTQQQQPDQRHVKKAKKGMSSEKKRPEIKRSFGRYASERQQQQQGLKKKEYAGSRAAETSSAGAAAASGDDPEAPDPTEDGMSVSRKRKLDAEKKRMIRNHDADYIKQCFRMYGQLLAAPRSGEDGWNSVAPADADDAGAHQTSKREASSSVSSSSRRSPAVQKAATALYNFVLPRVKQNDQHLCTSRSIQMLLKYGNDGQRKTLWSLLKNDFPDLCTGRHSCQVAMKLYLYGESSCQQEIMELLKDSKTGKPVFFSKFGARVWEYVYTAAKSEKLQAQMLRSILLPPLAIVRHPNDVGTLSFPALFEKFDPETKKLTLDHLAAVVQSCVDKELLDRAPVHKLLQHYTTIASPERLQDVMNVTAEGFLRLASTKSGVEAMVTLAGFATAKQRKHLVKEMRKHVTSMAKNAVDCVFVLRLLCTVDDTRLLKEGIVQPLLTDLEELVIDPFGQLIILQLLEDSAELSRYLPPSYKRLLELPSPTSLKRIDVRLNELRGPVLEALEAAFLQLANDPAMDDISDFSSAVKGRSSKATNGNKEEKEDSDKPIRPSQQHLQVSHKKAKLTLNHWISDPKASRVLTMLFHHSSRSSVFSALVAHFSQNHSATLAYVDRPQVQRFLSGLTKQMESFTETSSWTRDTLTVSDSNELKAEVYGTFLRDMWSCMLKPQLVPILTTRGVFLVSDVLEAARRLALKDLEDDVVGCLDPAVLSEARMKLMKEGASSVGLDILAAKRVREDAKPQV